MSYKYKKFGWKKDKFDKRDFIHKPRALRAYPDKVDLSSLLPSVRDQGNLGACVGFGVGANLAATAKQQNVYTEWFSPKWIYNGARFLAGDLPYDSGAYPRDAFEWLLDKGGLLEHFWPYSDTLDPTPPPAKFDSEAAKYPLLSYVRITDGIPNICDALAEGHIVSLGIPWFAEWMDVGADGVLPNISATSECVGGHEVVIYGYDAIDQVFLGMNSWGDEWGKNGHFKLPMQAFGFFAAQGGYDAHYVNVQWSGVEPTPWVEKKMKWYWWLLIIGGILGGLAILLF